MTADAFQVLLVSCLPGLRSFLYSRVDDRARADDVLQQAMLRAFVHRGQLRAEEHFAGWMRAIVWRQVQVSYRGRRRFLRWEDAAAGEPRAPQPSPLERLERLEVRGAIARALRRLGARDRAAIQLRDIQGRTIAESAAVLGASQAALKSMHFRARRRLAKVLAENPATCRCGGFSPQASHPVTARPGAAQRAAA
jgi:RNA polymerase sigma-70 factor (ECF subfamily)